MKQPNNWSCLPTAYAIITDQPLTTVLEKLGHDGSQIVDPSTPEPGCRKGFNCHEIIDLAFRQGFSLTPIDRNPVRITDVEKYYKGFDAAMPLFDDSEKRFNYYLTTHPRGIITGSTSRFPHAVAWLNPVVQDPMDGLTKRLDMSGLVEIDCYWVLSKI